MKILAFSDWRVQSINMLNSIIQDNKPDAILYAGDDLKKVIPMESDLYLKSKNHFIKFNKETIKDNKHFVVNEKNQTIFNDFLNKVKVKESIKIESIPLFYVNGNDDIMIKEGEKYFIKISPTNFQKNFKNIYVVETPSHKITTKDAHSFKRGIFNTFDIDEVSSDIAKYENTGFYRQVKINPSFGQHKIFEDYSFYGIKCKTGLIAETLNSPKKYSEIFLTHLPPLGCLDLSTRFGTRHIGSEQILSVVKEFNPKFVICGHSHFWGGKSEKINETNIINISSHDNYGAPGNYVLIDTITDKYEIKTANFKNLRQVRGAYFKSEVNLKIYGGGITYSHNLLDGDNEQIIKSLEQNNKSIIANRIRSIGWAKPKIIKRLSFNPADYALIDIETGLYEGGNIPFGVKKIKMWLIGLLYKGELVQFEYPSQKVDFIKFLKDHNISDLISWTKFDSKILSSIRELNKIKWHDACQRATFCIIWHSYKLHELYNLIFDKTDFDIIDGSVAGIYANHLIISNKECKYCPSINEVRIRIKERNKNDLLQMFELCDYLWKYETEK